MLLKGTLASAWLVARGESVVAYKKTGLAGAHLYPPSGCEM